MLILLAGLIPAQAQAQRLYRFEAGGAAAYQTFDKTTELAGSVGGTGRFGYWIWRKLSVEAEASFAVPKSQNGRQVTVLNLAGAGLFNLPIGFYNSAYLKAGFGTVGYGSCPKNIAPNTICGSSTALVTAVGGRFALSPTMMLRSEILMSSSSSPSFSNFSVSAGLSWMLGSRPLNDSDKDGVYDRYDRCPATPLGAIADSHGCPTDTDKDGVLDGLDRCPNSPSGTTVDLAGCPKDTDRDGVLDGLDRCEATPAGAAVDVHGCPSDSDGDGVLDGLDRCARTPAGATVDRLGCPGDQDNDRVFDGIDQCPNTPPGTVVNSFGCAIVEDRDRDGVADVNDRCPDTPPGTAVNSFGCPLALDSDKDGVPDAVDLCPGTPSGTQVDPYGCPATAPTARVDSTHRVRRDTTPTPRPPAVPTALGRWTVPGNAFALRSATIRQVVIPQLDSIARYMVANPPLKVEIGGNAQDRLPPSENLKLSTDRAQAIRLYLLTKGVRGTQLEIKGYGATDLITPDSTDLARVRNRRTEIRPISPP